MFGAEKGKADKLDGTDLVIGIVQARFNESITDTLAESCRAELVKLGVQAKDIDHYKVPGALETNARYFWADDLRFGPRFHGQAASLALQRSTNNPF